MKGEELKKLLNPEMLLSFESELRAANGTVLVKAGALAGVKMNLMTGGGFEDEVVIWDEPQGAAVGGATISEVAERTRPASADEERSWIARSA